MSELTANQVRVNELASKVLGKQFNEYKTNYDPTLLVSIARELNREDQGIVASNFQGADVWHAYEISFLSEKGLPTTAVGKIVIPADSEFFVESKSLKLYLFSLNMERFGKTREEGLQIVTETIKKDLSEALQTDVEVHLHLDSADRIPFHEVQSIESLIDVNSIEFSDYSENKGLLQSTDTPGSIFVELSGIRSNCRVTNQPDFSNLFVQYEGPRTLDLESLMQFAVSFRNENHFHEEVAEFIFNSLNDELNPDKLFVGMCYSRRGGVDINPVRYKGICPEEVATYMDATTLTNKTAIQ